MQEHYNKAMCDFLYVREHKSVCAVCKKCLLFSDLLVKQDVGRGLNTSKALASFSQVTSTPRSADRLTSLNLTLGKEELLNLTLECTRTHRCFRDVRNYDDALSQCEWCGNHQYDQYLLSFLFAFTLFFLLFSHYYVSLTVGLNQNIMKNTGVVV